MHGLWPECNNGSYPSFCTKQTFDPNNVKTIEPSLDKYWPVCILPTSMYIIGSRVLRKFIRTGFFLCYYHLLLNGYNIKYVEIQLIIHKNVYLLTFYRYSHFTAFSNLSLSLPSLPFARFYYLLSLSGCSSHLMDPVI